MAPSRSLWALSARVPSSSASASVAYTSARPISSSSPKPAPPPPPGMNRASHSSLHNPFPPPSPLSSQPLSAPYYDLFPKTLPLGPPPTGPFHINVRALRQEFLRLQAHAHPDLHHQPAAKAGAEARSALINEAYRTLCNPLLRAQYLLGRAGRTSQAAEGAQLRDQSLLMEVLEAQEAAEEAEGQAEVDALIAANEDRAHGCVDRISRFFADGDWDAVEREAVRLRFWDSLGRSLHEWQPGKPGMMVH